MLYIYISQTDCIAHIQRSYKEMNILSYIVYTSTVNQQMELARTHYHIYISNKFT
jgi:hypothetical protein